MRDTSRGVRLEAVVYLIIILVAALLRLARLDWPPLTDPEAGRALAANSLQGNPVALDSGPSRLAPGAAYEVPTAVLFLLTGATEAKARLVPAIAGVALCLTPLLARRRLGPANSLALGLLLALSPIMVTLSRTAGGTSLAGLGLLSALLLLVGADGSIESSRRSSWAAAFIALALTAGPGYVHGLASLGLAAALTAIWRARQESPPSPLIRLSFSRRDLWIALIVLIALASGFGMSRGGIGDPFQSLGNWLQGWSSRGGLPVLASVLLIPVYEPILLVFGLVGALISFRRGDQAGVAASFWALGATLALAAYPSRSAVDLLWIAFPASFLAARVLVVLAESVLAEGNWLRFGGMTVAFGVLVAFIYLQVVAYAIGLGPELAILDPRLRLGIIVVAGLIGVVLLVLFGTGWSWAAAGQTVGVVAFGALLALSSSSVFRMNYTTKAAEGAQLWQPRVTTVGLRELTSTLDFLSKSYRDDPGGLTLEIAGSAPPSLIWALRDFGRAPVVPSSPAPPVVLAPDGSEPNLRADYYGQKLEIAETNDWEGALPPDVLSWWIFHRAPVKSDNWLLLVRADVATQGGTTSLGSDTNP